jgi:hypothetical protein
MTYVRIWLSTDQSLYKWCYSRYSVANHKTNLVVLRFSDQLSVSFTNPKPLMQALLAGEGVPASAVDQELAINKVRYHKFSTYVIDRWHPSFSFCFGSSRQYLAVIQLNVMLG